MPRQYSKGARSAAAFLEAANKEFGSRGYLSTKVEDIARTAGTISYEVTCGVSQRVPRRYGSEGESVA